MKLIIGLGNPEEEYSRTRHNMGFDVVNILAKQENIEIKRNQFNSIVGNGIIQNEKIILIKPQTYMNLSGKAIFEAMQFYKISAKDIMVIYDDMDIEPGIIKIRKQGGPRFTQWNEICCTRNRNTRIHSNQNRNWKTKILWRQNKLCITIYSRRRI